MATYRLMNQGSVGLVPGDALRLSAGAQGAPAANAQPIDTSMRLLSFQDTLSLTANAPQAASTDTNTARVQPLGPLARARAAQATAQTASVSPVPRPAPAPAAPAPAPAPAPVAAPQAPAYKPETDDAQVAQPIAQAGSDDAAFKAAEDLLIKELLKRHAQPTGDQDPDNQSAQPNDKPADKPDAGDAQKLKDLAPAELARLGQEDKQGFFDALRPAAEEAEKKYGVPAAITLAQAALETGWAQHIIPGYNIFGIKGTGPDGTTSQGTWEVYSGKKVTITANFAKYHNFYEAVLLHGKLFHNGYYDKAVNLYAKDHDPFAFAKNITGVYATDPSYGEKLSSIIRQYKLV